MWAGACTQTHEADTTTHTQTHSVCMYACMYVCMTYVCMIFIACSCKCVHVCATACMRVHVNTHACLCACACVRACVRACRIFIYFWGSAWNSFLETHHEHSRRALQDNRVLHPKITSNHIACVRARVRVHMRFRVECPVPPNTDDGVS